MQYVLVWINGKGIECREPVTNIEQARKDVANLRYAGLAAWIARA